MPVVRHDGVELQTHGVGCSKVLEGFVPGWPKSIPPGAEWRGDTGSPAYVEDTFGGDVQGIAVAAARGFGVAREYLNKLAAVAELARLVAEGRQSRLMLVSVLGALDAVGFGREPKPPSEPPKAG